MIKVFLPYKIREILDVPVEIEAEGTNLRGLIDYLENMYPGVKNQLVEDDKLKFIDEEVFKRNKKNFQQFKIRKKT